MNNVDLIIKWIRETDVTTLPYNVLSVSWGPKEKNGQRTGEYGLIFTVENKIPVQDLSPEAYIPGVISMLLDTDSDKGELVTLKTDVQEVKIHELYGVTTTCHPRSDTTDPVRQNRIRRRPLVGGIESMASYSNMATLGLFVKDNTDGQIVALSNNHVYALSQVVASRKLFNTGGRSTTLNLSGYQPTGYWKTHAQNDYIGLSKRGVLIGNVSLTGSYVKSSCDAALLSLKDYTLINSTDSPNVLGFLPRAPFPFATDAEIDSLAPGGSNSGVPIFRSGRTSGPIGFPGTTTTCMLSVYQIGSSLVGSYSGVTSEFPDSFYVEGNVSPGAPGDSGSALFALFNANNPSLSAWKVIGLLFAGPGNNSFTIGCRITNIARDLNISPWDTTIPAFSSTRSVVVLDSINTNTVTLSGRMFYQVGFESNNL